MAASPRLPFLWPMLFRASEQAAPMTRHTTRRRAKALQPATTRRHQSGAVVRRYGQANEPPPYLGGGKGYGPSTREQGQQGQEEQKDAKALPRIGEQLQQDGERQNGQTSPPSGKQEHRTIDAHGKSSPTGDPMLDHPDGAPPEKSADSLLDTVMDPVHHEKEGQNTPPPPPNDSSSSDSSTASDPNTAIALSSPHHTEDHSPSLHNSPPHIDKPRYIHHFDTYGLVRRLHAGDWTQPQAITLMKSMRLLLGDNLSKATQALVSKSDVENESYLFSAACSELRTEVFARRVALQEQMRMERDQLQHEVDILEQRLGQETAGMKDELRGMFDDRKMAVRNEQRAMESKVQELNYKITVSLQADSKSDVEGVRWVLTRRVIFTLGIIVLMVVGSLKLYSNQVHEREVERKRRQKAKMQERMEGERRGGSGGVGGGNGDMKSAAMLVNEGDNPAFVSLG